MATLEKIRSRSGLLLGIIGFALLAFVVGDLFNGQTGVFGGRSTDVAEIDGTAISYQNYLVREQEFSDTYKRSGNVNDAMSDQIKAQVWDDLIHETIMGEEYDDLGLSVGTKELSDLILGNNLDPIIPQLFTNPQTGQVDKAGIAQFLAKVNDKTIPEADRQYWFFIKKDIKKRRAFAKYMALISKGLYVTTPEAQADFDERSYMVDFKYVAQPYANVPDADVKADESDYKKYYDAHKSDFEQEESRNLDYVVFEVLPSKTDKEEAMKYISGVKPEFETTNDVSRFVTRNSETPYQERFYKKGTLSTELDSVMFNASEGFVFGPYEEGGKYKLAKLVSRKQMPDSVEVRHILIPTNAGVTVEAAKAKIDSIKRIIQTGKTFAEMATEFGSDASKEKGGDLGWVAPGRMVKPFNDAIFAATKNQLQVVETQYGVHLVEVTGISEKSNSVSVAIVDRSIVASSQTYQDVYSQANKFATENTNQANFEKAIASQGLNKRTASSLSPIESRIAGLESPRKMVQWAYESDTKIGDFSQVFEFSTKLVIARLTAIHEKGIATLAEVLPQVQAEVIKQKKAEMLIAKMKGGKSLEQLASEFKTEVKEASNITFASRQIPGLGVEPAVIGKSTSLAKDKISEPIQGVNGVYVLQVTVITNPKFDKKPSIEPNKMQL
ncbi:MAG: hypothetical protein RIS47_1229, partial [Bacteroidota bacterium]